MGRGSITPCPMSRSCSAAAESWGRPGRHAAHSSPRASHPLVLGTSVGAVNGAVFASAPTGETVDRLETHVDQAVRRRHLRRFAAAENVDAGPHAHPHPFQRSAAGPVDRRAGRGARIEDLRVRFQCVAASIERAAEHLVRERTGDRRGDGQQCGSRAATAGGDRRRHHLDGGLVLDTGRAGDRARGTHRARPACRQDRAPARTAAPSLGGGNGGLRDRPLGTGSRLTWPRSRTTSPSTCCRGDPDRLTMPTGRCCVIATPRVSPSGSSSPTKRSPPTWPGSGRCPAVPSRGHRPCGRRRDG